jgi:hypothetical protein
VGAKPLVQVLPERARVTERVMLFRAGGGRAKKKCGTFRNLVAIEKN